MLNNPAKKLMRALQTLRKAGIQVNAPINNQTAQVNQLDTLEQRVKKIVRIVNNSNRNALSMIFFVMYDIENNKVRRYIAKYLERKGCIRIQKSVFIAEGERRLFDDIAATLLAVQQAYENHDSLFVVPVSTDQLKAMKIVGQGFNRDIFANPPNTLFF